MLKLNMKDIAIIDAFPTYPGYPVFGHVLNVGCGEGRLDYHVANMGYKVYATDVKERKERTEDSPLSMPFARHVSDIFDLSSFPIQSSPIVICSQLLEHLKEYKKAFSNLLKLTEIRLIITMPYRRSFPTPTHCNFWDDIASDKFKDIHEFVELSKPYSIAISKIITKQCDAGRQFAYLMVIDKRQNTEDRNANNRMVC